MGSKIFRDSFWDSQEDNEFSDEEIGEHFDKKRATEANCFHVHKKTVKERLNQAAMKIIETTIECEKCGKIFFHDEKLVDPLTESQIMR